MLLPAPSFANAVLTGGSPCGTAQGAILPVQKYVFHGKFIFHRFDVCEDRDDAPQGFPNVGLEILGDMMGIMDCPVAGDKHMDRDKPACRSLACA